MSILEIKDVIRLLRSEVKRAGGQAAWASKTGINRVIVNKVLGGKASPTKSIIRALGLRMVFVFERGLQRSRQPIGKVARPSGR